MNNKNLTKLILPILVALITFSPAQVALCQSATNVEKIETESTKVVTVKEETLEPVKSETTSSEDVPVLNDESKKTAPESEPPEAKKSSLSTGAIVGISAGAIVLVGAVAVLAGGGGGGGDDSSSPAVPPTAEQLVDAWQATANQPGSGLTYSGTYQLFQGGSILYDIYVSDGEHLTGNGSWSLSGYQLSIHTNHGSLYVGNFAPGNITSVDLNANTGWNLHLSR